MPVAWGWRGPGHHLEPSAALARRGSPATELPQDRSSPAVDDSPHRLPHLSLDSGLVFERLTGERYQFVHTGRAAPALHVDPLSRPGRPAGVRQHGAAGPEPRDRSAPTTSAPTAWGTYELAAGDDSAGARRAAAVPFGRRSASASTSTAARVVLPGEVLAIHQRVEPGAEAELTAWRSWSARAACPVDAEQSNTLRGEASVQYRPSPDTVVNVGYRVGPLSKFFNNGMPVSPCACRCSWSCTRGRSIRRRTGRSTVSPCSRFRNWRSLAGLAGVGVTSIYGESDNSIPSARRLTGLRRVGNPQRHFPGMAFGDTPPPPIPPTPERARS